ncbi:MULTISPECIES: YggS family pyridoxal phosphate-dependent enzyme [unclassified Nitrospina]|uniref:YggS family pyridoxal phosphate-dependent enzyme n=1 Tax=unclassified Nitrospina TaxID=2638683 RepID=UPI003F9B2CC8
MTSLDENIAVVRQRICEAALRAGRDPESVRLVAVSKTVPMERIRAARQAGADVFGENKVQEAMEKIETLGSKDFHWHFIGHLQKNKVKYVVGHFDLVHSVDSTALADKLDTESQKQGVVTNVLIQVNVSGEASKFGIDPGNLEDLLRRAGALSGIAVKGLMTIPPYTPDAEEVRKHFASLRTLRDRMRECKFPGISLEELSMGMSHDYEIAVEEGATWVRVGTALFGERSG